MNKSNKKKIEKKWHIFIHVKNNYIIWLTLYFFHQLRQILNLCKMNHVIKYIEVQYLYNDILLSLIYF